MEFKQSMSLDDWYGPFWSGYRPMEISAALHTGDRDISVLFEHEYYYVINTTLNETVAQAKVYQN